VEEGLLPVVSIAIIVVIAIATVVLQLDGLRGVEVVVVVLVVVTRTTVHNHYHQYRIVPSTILNHPGVGLAVADGNHEVLAVVVEEEEEGDFIEEEEVDLVEVGVEVWAVVAITYNVIVPMVVHQ
jgi:hypothetical protein